MFAAMHLHHNFSSRQTQKTNPFTIRMQTERRPTHIQLKSKISTRTVPDNQRSKTSSRWCCVAPRGRPNRFQPSGRGAQYAMIGRPARWSKTGWAVAATNLWSSSFRGRQDGGCPPHAAPRHGHSASNGLEAHPDKQKRNGYGNRI